ncbi:hypothetical protein [Pseudoalteromonas luteoviolacea]|uniref:Right handed beta helix domain-containing protein n=1 Tax=Pseudoalteromonas luteoviolacea H33 TaxID=1365251 RepID=A0A162A7I0_9GAMM|nr:hypothetical protein [Pseudoalteromonas luteoviolacea]KZN45383.1 hypothetical protein N476_05035 [Pseudoalteromonas luteoviolacea H33]KZN70753.1 hypothetical protein N477_05005 [Pseudoalteromonas luteoviolacea H33-S]MBQ4879113.1 hypothetical protein [Pseudoalteromonas luteoviolacea]MBQ4908132.1 hypothetical protein [Pseudoalteromonas luteoviolacea]
MKRICFGIVLLLLSVSVFARHEGDLCWGWDDSNPPELKEEALRSFLADSRIGNIYICGQPILITKPLIIDRPVRFEGIGHTAQIIAKSKFADSAAMLKFTENASGSQIRQVVIDGGFLATKGVEVQGVDGIDISYSVFSRFLGTDFKTGTITHYSEIYPARAIQITNSRNIHIFNNFIDRVGGYDASSDRYFNGVDLVREGRLAHRGISIVGSASGQVEVSKNTIRDVYGYLDSSAIYVQSMDCVDRCYYGVISDNDINAFGNNGIKLLASNFNVHYNRLFSNGQSNSVDRQTIGTTSSAIFSLCHSTPCSENIISSNVIELQRAYRGIQAIGEHYVGGNQVTIHSPHITARGMLTYEFSLQVSSGLSHFSGNRIYGEAKNPHLGATNYADGYCINSVSHTYRSEVYHDCDPVLPSTVLLRH